MKPNIFDIATKELNQDAFIVWLLQYADDRDSESYTEDDKLINLCSKEFIKDLFANVYANDNITVKKVDAGRQWENIDIWAEINDKYLLIIEDKTVTGLHSNQLARYKETAEKWCASHIPIYEKPICIYLKTGNESLSSLSKVEEQGFSVFNRRNFLELLTKHPEIKNQIFVDFKERLFRLEAANNNYADILIRDWEGDDWVGFYQFLDSSIGLINWNYVNNPAGGFWCAVLDWPYWKGFPVHFQIEQGKLCFKIAFDPEEIDLEEGEFDAKKEQDEWQSILLEKAKTQFPEIQRPYPYVHRGNYRTVAFIDRESWLGKDEETLDKEVVVKRLVEYKAFMKDLTNEKNFVEH